MRKVVVISVLFVVLLVTGLVLYFSWRERKAEQEAMAIFKDMFECPYEEARQKVEAHYVWMSGLYTQLDSLGPERILTAGDRGAYRDFLRSQQEVPLHVMSYEVLYQANRKYYEDTLELSVNWPWLGVYQPAWLRWPLLDTNMAHGLLTSYSIKGDLCATSRQLTENQYGRYMIILVPEEKNDGKWIGADDISTTSAYGDARRSYSAVLEPASFRGIWVVYDVEHSKIACAYPIAFANSDKMSTSIEEEKHSYSIRDKQNAYNKMIGDNLAANFKKAVIALYNDSLGVPDNKTRINPY